MSIVDQLKEMGFDPIKAERAVKETGGISIEEAMEWILAQNEEELKQQPGPSRPPPAPAAAATAGAATIAGAVTGALA